MLKLAPILLLWTLSGALNLNAQVTNNMKLVIETGLLQNSDFDRLGPFLNIEPKFEVADQTFLGLRIGATANSHAYDNFDSTRYEIDEVAGNGVISIIPTLDRYFGDAHRQPFVGFGVGPYLLASRIEVFTVEPNPTEFEIYASTQIGLFLRAGLETPRTRIGLEYNFVPKADINLPDGETMGTVSNSFVALSAGVVIGGGKFR